MRVFDVPFLSCYGQPGSSWAPQAFAALRDIGVVTPAGVPAYVDEGTHVGIGEQPFWYDGVLTVFNMGRNATRMELHEAGGLEQGQADFKAATIASGRRAAGWSASTTIRPSGCTVSSGMP